MVHELSFSVGGALLLITLLAGSIELQHSQRLQSLKKGQHEMGVSLLQIN